MATSCERLRQLAEQIRRLPEVHRGAEASSRGINALHELEADGAKLVWQAYQTGAFREGSRFETCLGSALARLGSPDQAHWEESDLGPMMRLDASGPGFECIKTIRAEGSAKQDPEKVWCMLVWDHVQKIISPDVSVYGGSRAVSSICGRIAKTIEAESAMIEAETTTAAAAITKKPSSKKPVPTEWLSKTDLSNYFNIYRSQVKARVLDRYPHETSGKGKGERYRMQVSDMPPAYQQKHLKQK